MTNFVEVHARNTNPTKPGASIPEEEEKKELDDVIQDMEDEGNNAGKQAAQDTENAESLA